MAKALTQRDRREHRVFVDQHDREYDATIERITGDPCEVLRPRFNAPWRLPEDQKYYLYRTDPTDLQLVVLNYDAYIDDVHAARKQLQRELDQRGYTKYKEAYDPRNPPQELLAALGSPLALASPVPAIMAKRGDGWVLALLDENGQPYPKPDWADSVAVFRPALSRDDQILEEQLIASLPPELPEAAKPKGPGARRRRKRVRARTVGHGKAEPALVGA